MEKDNYKRQLQMFRKRAAFYQQCEARMHAMEKASTVREAMSPYGINEYTMLKDNNSYVQCVLGWIKENYGTDAADIIAKKGDTYCFVEVKTRAGEILALPSEAVGRAKRQRYHNMARYFCAMLREEVPIRFDVAAVLDGKLEYYENAY